MRLARSTVGWRRIGLTAQSLAREKTKVVVVVEPGILKPGVVLVGTGATSGDHCPCGLMHQDGRDPARLLEGVLCRSCKAAAHENSKTKHGQERDLGSNGVVMADFSRVCESNLFSFSQNHSGSVFCDVFESKCNKTVVETSVNKMPGGQPFSSSLLHPPLPFSPHYCIFTGSTDTVGIKPGRSGASLADDVPLVNFFMVVSACWSAYFDGDGLA